MTNDDSSVIPRQLLALFDDPAAQWDARFDEGIRRHRMGPMRLRFVHADGTPASDVSVTVRQTRHDFLFGCNLFQLGGFNDAELNRLHDHHFTDLFNSGVAPFYWSALEPAPGQLRFAADSSRIPRRPPPDTVTDFCESHGITPKGHCLAWHQLLPDWLPSDPAKTGRLLAERIAAIARRYGHRIPMWDVVNEPMEKYLFPRASMLPGDYVAEVFRHAAKSLPPDTALFLNEATTFSWREFHGRTTGLHLLEENLRLRGCKVDGLGLQYHLFFYDRDGLTATVNDLVRARDTYLDPRRLLSVLDLHAAARPGRPIHVSEITIPSYPDLDDNVAEDLQASISRRLYRLWFSHPGVEGIYWWNLADGGAHGREGRLRAGLLREDLSPKPVHRTLRSLIRDEWTTRLSLRGDAHGLCSLRGFYGDYEIVAEHDGILSTHRVGLHKNASSEFTLALAPSGSKSTARPDCLAMKT